MNTIIMERMGHRAVPQGTDEALIAFPIPSECTLSRLKFEAHMVASAARDVVLVSAYGAHWFFLPLLDPDSETNLDAIWDALVPKSQAVIDADLSDVAVTDAVWEPGQTVEGALFDITVSAPEKMWSKRKYLTYADAQTGFQAGSPDTYIPTHRFNDRIGQRYRATTDSVVMYGVSSPDFVEAVTNNAIFAALPAIGNLAKFAMVKYVDHVIEAMMWDVIGIGAEGASGAALPFEDSTVFLQNLLSDFGFIDNANFAAGTWDATVVAEIALDVPGDLAQKSISAR